MNEIEKRVESEPSGSSELCSELCEGTAVVGSVGGLRGAEKSIQLSGETAAAQSQQSDQSYHRMRIKSAVVASPSHF